MRNSGTAADDQPTSFSPSLRQIRRYRPDGNRLTFTRRLFTVFATGAVSPNIHHEKTEHSPNVALRANRKASARPLEGGLHMVLELKKSLQKSTPCR
jgi:hypothetical protein